MGGPGNQDGLAAFAAEEKCLMPARDVALITALGLSLIPAAPVHASDALFGDILAVPEARSLTIGSEVQHRERESQALRRTYWQRERRFIATDATASGRRAPDPIATIR